MKIQALEITNNTDPENPVIELITETSLPWTVELLDGKAPIVVGPSVITGYQDISTIENFSMWGAMALGKFPGFRDWKTLRSEIKTLALEKAADSFSNNWANLNAEEQKICCKYLTNIVPSVRFAETYSDELDRLKLSLDFDKNSQEARGQRVSYMRLVLMGAIGSTNALKFFSDTVKESLVETFAGGIESKATDGVEGLIDMIDGTADTKYSSDQQTEELKGLRHRGYQIIDGSGDSLGDVCDTLKGMAVGLY